MIRGIFILICFQLIHILCTKNLLAQEYFEEIFWSRVDIDSSGNYEEERTKHFDVHGFSFESKNNVRYWPLAPCYLSSGLVCEYTYDKDLNQIRFDFHRYLPTSIDSISDSVGFSKTYRVELIETNEFRDTSRLKHDLDFAKSWGLTRVDYLMQLHSLEDDIILRYEGHRYKRDDAFKRFSRHARKVNRKSNRKDKRARKREEKAWKWE